MDTLRTFISNNRLRLLLGLIVVVLVWLTFFDSHSLLKRYRWHSELRELQTENEHLRERIAELEHELADGISDEQIERIAREQYGMRRPGETVYRVEEQDAP